MSDTISYTHWAFFDDKPAAEACAKTLDQRFDCLTLVDRAKTMPRWRLRAARPINPDLDYHSEIRIVVESFGGDYDYGEACMFAHPSPDVSEQHAMDAPPREFEPAGARIARLKAELGRNYISPSEVADAVSDVDAQEHIIPADPALTLGAAATVRMLADWLDAAVDRPYALYSPRQIGDALDDISRAAYALSNAMLRCLEAITAAHRRGDVPEDTQVRVEAIVRAMMETPRTPLASAAHGVDIAAELRRIEYSGYADSGETSHLVAVAQALVAADPAVVIRETSPADEDAGMLGCIRFEYDGSCFSLTANGWWEIRFEDASGVWQSRETDAPVGSIVHPLAVATSALAVARASLGASEDGEHGESGA